MPKTKKERYPIGTPVQHKVFPGMVGEVAKVSSDRLYGDPYYTVKLDPSVGHFTDELVVVAGELWTRKDAELDDAEWTVRFYLREWEDARANELAWKQRRQQARKQLLDARKELNRVKKLSNDSFKRSV